MNLTRTYHYNHVTDEYEEHEVKEIEAKPISGTFLVPLTQKEIEDKIQEIKNCNLKIDEITRYVAKVIAEVRDGRAEKLIKGALQVPNYDTKKNEIYYNGLKIFEVTMEDQDLQIPLAADAVGDLITPKQSVAPLQSNHSSSDELPL